MAAFARESDNLRASIRELAADAARTPTRALASLNARVPADARVRARDPARRPRDAGHDRRRRSRGSRRRASWSPRPSSAGWPRSSRRRPRDLARLIDASLELLPQTDLAVALRARRRPADRRRRRSQDEFATGAQNYKEFFYDAGRARRRGPELRRQRHVRALPDRRRHADASSLGSAGVGDRPAVRQQRRRAARQPAGLPGQAPAVQARACPATSSAPEPQRPGGAKSRRPARRDAARPRDKLTRAAPPPASCSPFGHRAERRSAK